MDLLMQNGLKRWCMGSGEAPLAAHLSNMRNSVIDYIRD